MRDATVFTRHLLALGLVAAFSFGVSYLLYHATDWMIRIRVRPDQEEAGLDVSQHAETLGASA